MGKWNRWFTDLTGERGPEALLQTPCGPSEDLRLHPVHYISSQRIGHTDFYLVGRICFHPFVLANPDGETAPCQLINTRG